MINKQYTAKQKLEMVRRIKEMITRDVDRLNVSQACAKIRICPRNYNRWLKQEQQLRDADKSKFKLHKGPTPHVSEEIKQKVLAWIEERKNMGERVTYVAIGKQIASLDANYALKTPKQQQEGARRIVVKHEQEMRDIKKKQRNIARSSGFTKAAPPSKKKKDGEEITPPPTTTTTTTTAASASASETTTTPIIDQEANTATGVSILPTNENNNCIESHINIES